MGTGVCEANILSNEPNLSPTTTSVAKLANESCGFVEAEDRPSTQKSLVAPETPVSNRENGDAIRDMSSPFTSVSSVLDVPQGNSPISPNGADSGTPKDCVFDPFAPGPDKFALAPIRKKFTEDLQTKVARRLTFTTSSTKLVTDMNHESDTETSSYEDQLFDIMYSSILDDIVSEQTKELVAVPVRDSVSDLDEFRTPKSAPRLSWIAETCPGAPLKCTSKFRKIDKVLCRKLEF